MSQPNRRRFLVEAGRGALAVGAGAALAWPARPAAARSPQDFLAAERKAMDQCVADFMARYRVPGMSIAIAREGRLVLAAGYGMADRATLTRVDPGHLFRVASVSKPITAVAVMGLVEQGRLGLDDRVFGADALLGTTYGSKPYGEDLQALTVRHLLEHTAGGWSNDEDDPMFSHPKFDHAELIGWVLDDRPLQHPPGANYAYSNFGYCVLGRVIERVTGQPYADYVRQAVLAACGVTNMHVAGDTLAERRPDEVVYYGQDGEDPYAYRVARMDAHGGWLASATDLVRLAARVDGFDSVPDILRGGSIAAMTTPSAASPGYALGWSVNLEDNWWHMGSLPGTATVLVRTSGGLCWAALANTRRGEGDMMGDLDGLPWAMIGCVSEWPEGDAV